MLPFAFPLLILLIISSFLLGFYIFVFIFTHGSSPGKNERQDKYINETCAPSGLLKTVLTWGYAKASFRRFYNVYRLKLFPQPQASLGKLAPDAKVISLSGKVQYLFSDYISKVPQGMPIILNMGSYT